MTRVVYPRLRLSANGAAALLDTVDEGVLVCDLPNRRVRWRLDGNLAHLCLSASGTAAAWLDGDGRIVVRTEAGAATRDSPVSPDRIRALTVGDDGDAIVILSGGESASSHGRLVIQDGAGDLVAIERPVFDSGSLLANQDCTMVVAISSDRIGGERTTMAYARDGDVLRPLWGHGEASAHGELALYGARLVAATDDGLAVWTRSGERATLPGTLRDRLIFSPDGRWLLAYRVAEVIEVTDARIGLRLIDLDAPAEARSTVHVVKDRQGAHFALDAALDLYEVRATRAGELAMVWLGWEGPA